MAGKGRRELLHRIFERMLDAFGAQHWWPAETPFEVMVGAILTQNTAWRNVERSIAELRERNLLDPESLYAMDMQTLASLIRSSGYYNQKARRLKDLCRYLCTQWQGDLDRFLGQEMDVLRTELLRLNGIGPETADSIILYAALQPSFVVDTYTYRILSRHGWAPEDASYDELRGLFMDSLEPDVAFFQEFHALLVRVGNCCCRRKPRCSSCVLSAEMEG